jgi:microcystin-dependent protein
MPIFRVTLLAVILTLTPLTSYAEPDCEDTKTRIVCLEETVAKLQQEIESRIPSGIISMWSGSIDKIPEGWVLCDGNHGTPDLRNRFIVGAGRDYGVRNTGGTNTATTSNTGSHTHGHSLSVQPHTLTINQIPSHNHPYYDYYWIDEGKTSLYGTKSGDDSGERRQASRTTSAIGGNKGHSHGLSGAINSGGSSHTHTVDNRPLYYALAFIMKQ